MTTIYSVTIERLVVDVHLRSFELPVTVLRFVRETLGVTFDYYIPGFIVCGCHIICKRALSRGLFCKEMSLLEPCCILCKTHIFTPIVTQFFVQ